MDLTPFFRETALGKPATYTNAAGISKEVVVVPHIDDRDQSVGDSRVNSSAITIHAKTEDVQDADNASRIVTHDLLVNETGEPLCDEDGEQFQAEGIGTYNTTNTFEDGNGFSVLTCSKE